MSDTPTVRFYVYEAPAPAVSPEVTEYLRAKGAMYSGISKWVALLMAREKMVQPGPRGVGI